LDKASEHIVDRRHVEPIPSNRLARRVFWRVRAILSSGGARRRSRPACGAELGDSTTRHLRSLEPCLDWWRPAVSAGPVVFFLSYAGSGRTIQCLARFQLPPRRTMASSIVGAERGSRSGPARDRHWPAVGASRHARAGQRSRGLWCRIARTCSRFSAFSTGSTLTGTFDPRGTHVRPRASNAWITFPTVCGAQGKVLAITAGFWASAPATKIWQRRTV